MGGFDMSQLDALQVRCLCSWAKGAESPPGRLQGRHHTGATTWRDAHTARRTGGVVWGHPCVASHDSAGGHCKVQAWSSPP